MPLNLEDVKREKQFIIKWGGASHTGQDQNGKMEAGWMLETQEDSFLTRLDEQTSILKDATQIKMDARTHALDYLFVRPHLQSMSTNGGMFSQSLSELNETIPKFARRELTAKPFVAYSYTPKQFIWENLEKESFLSEFESMLAEACGVSAESIAMYSDASGSGDYGQIAGVFKQLEQISELTDEEEIRENGKGYYGIIDMDDSNKTIAGQLMDMITKYMDQKGNIDKAVIYTSTAFRGKLLAEVTNRQTELGDQVLVNGRDISIFGVPIKVGDFLNRPANDFNERILMCDPKSIVIGFVSDIQSESTYEHSRKAYLSSVDLEFDAGLIYPVEW